MALYMLQLRLEKPWSKEQKSQQTLKKNLRESQQLHIAPIHDHTVEKNVKLTSAFHSVSNNWLEN